eukprot:TRINITY_DN38990_c0_g1_i1.p1 TRINITY_DN38990_c0_g1~~TRINITY_DN38990_c0_g1_i1.p1  ORF type:complete len:335 (-),score=85.72 TRINITY_DN38990_c0_g1_i1:14-1018(-)
MAAAAGSPSSATADLAIYRYVVHVIRGVDLINTDRLSKSDPYVIVSTGGITNRTNVIDNNLNPVWNERFIFNLDSPQEIHFEIYDKDKTGHDDFMGACKITWSELVSGVRASRAEKYRTLLVLERVKHGQLDVEVQVRKINVDWLEREIKNSKQEIGALDRDNKVLQLKVANLKKQLVEDSKKNTEIINEPSQPAHFETLRRMSVNLYRQLFRLEVLVLGATGLKSANINGTSDPFCVVQAGEFKQQTEVEKETLDPVWKEAAMTFVFEKPPTGLISFTVMDWGVVNVRLGEAELKANEFFRDDAGRKDLELDLSPKGKLHVQVLYFHMVTKGF